MGLSAIKSHYIGKLHKSREESSKGNSVKHYLVEESHQSVLEPSLQEILPQQLKPNTSKSVLEPSLHEKAQLVTIASQKQFQIKESVTKAEVVWVLKVIASKYSYNSCSDISTIFPLMFRDSDIAKAFTCSPTKCAYVVCHGLAPYFMQELAERARKASCYVISFDECHNFLVTVLPMTFEQLLIKVWRNFLKKNCSKYQWTAPM